MNKYEYLQSEDVCDKADETCMERYGMFRML